MRSKNQAECSKPTLRFTTTALGTHCLRSNSVSVATCSLDHSTHIGVGSNVGGRSAKARKESPCACPCRSNEPPKPITSKTRRSKYKHGTPSGFDRIGLCSRKPREKKVTLRRYPVLTSTPHFGL